MLRKAKAVVAGQAVQSACRRCTPGKPL